MASILVIDDDDTYGLLISGLLAEAGHDVALARSGDEGLRAHSEGAFELIITDIIMEEGKDGLQTIAELRKLPQPPSIIAMSGGGAYLMADEALALAAGFKLAGTFSKLDPPSGLLDIIGGALQPCPRPASLG